MFKEKENQKTKAKEPYLDTTLKVSIGRKASKREGERKKLMTLGKIKSNLKGIMINKIKLKHFTQKKIITAERTK